MTPSYLSHCGDLEHGVRWALSVKEGWLDVHAKTELKHPLQLFWILRTAMLETTWCIYELAKYTDRLYPETMYSLSFCHSGISRQVSVFLGWVVDELFSFDPSLFFELLRRRTDIPKLEDKNFN